MKTQKIYLLTVRMCICCGILEGDRAYICVQPDRKVHLQKKGFLHSHGITDLKIYAFCIMVCSLKYDLERSMHI